MKKYLPTAAAVGVALLAALPAQAEDLLTGDVRLACEATLCLSSGYRPHECTASLNRYFSIKHKKLDDTIRGRLNFLKLYPASNEKNMPQLINTIANGAGRCDAAELNRVMTSYYTTQKCYYRSNKAGGTYRNPDTFGEDIKVMTTKNLTLTEAQNSGAFGLMPRQRLRTVQRDLYEQLDKIKFLATQGSKDETEA